MAAFLFLQVFFMYIVGFVLFFPLVALPLKMVLREIFLSFDSKNLSTIEIDGRACM